MTKLIFNADVTEGFDDTKDNAWKFYSKKYGISESEKKVCIQGKKIEVSGECVYNFGSKYEKLKRIIEDIIEDKKRKELNDDLEICRKLHHSLPNIMVLPTNGALNYIKGSIYYSKDNGWRVKKFPQKNAREWLDRPDLLVCYINEYYTIKSHLNEMTFEETGKYLSNGVFTQSIINGETFPILLDTLNSFKGVKDFCSYFYQVDDGTVDTWLEGKHFFVEDNIEGYINQAFKFWSLQMKNIFEMLLKNKDTCIVINGDDICDYVQEELEAYPDKDKKEEIKKYIIEKR